MFGVNEFKINDTYKVVCKTNDAPSGFKHVATLFENGKRIKSSSISYSNRAWEQYRYESVLQKLLDVCTKKSLLSIGDLEKFLEVITF